MLGQASAEGGLVVSAPVYAELRAYPNAAELYVDNFLAKTAIETDFDIGEPIWRDAGLRMTAWRPRPGATLYLPSKP
jgi:hypothetical protein